MEWEQPYLGDLLTMVINHLLTGIILQVPGNSAIVPFWDSVIDRIKGRVLSWESKVRFPQSYVSPLIKGLWKPIGFL